MQEVCRLYNGYTLYRKPNGVGGHLYMSDEIDGGVVIWDTAMVGENTLLTAIVEEQRRAAREQFEEKMNAARNREFEALDKIRAEHIFNDRIMQPFYYVEVLKQASLGVLIKLGELLSKEYPNYGPSLKEMNSIRLDMVKLELKNRGYGS